MTVFLKGRLSLPCSLTCNTADIAVVKFRKCKCNNARNMMTFGQTKLQLLIDGLTVLKEHFNNLET